MSSSINSRTSMEIFLSKNLTAMLGTFLIMTSYMSGWAQTGPAGVGNFDGSNGQKENIIWLDASTLGLADGAAIATWPDLSGNGNDLVQQGADNTPLFETNGLFGANHNVALFDGTERYLTLPDNADLDNALGGITVIGVIYNPILDGVARAIYSKRNSSGSQQTYSAFTFSSSRLNFDVHNGGNRRLASTIGLNTATDYIFSNRYSGTLQEIYLQSDASGSNSTSGNISNTNSNLILGALNNDDGRYYNGHIAELIFYREALNDGERLIVENYLSQKYGITITNDFFGTAAGFDAAFVNDFMGIGTGDGTNKLGSSGFSDALQVSEANGSLNSANEFIMLAHDNTVHADNVTANITDPDITDRWARSWFLEATGDVSVEMRFDFGTAGLAPIGSASDYVLLYRATTADDYTRVLASTYVIENGDQLVVDLGNLSMPSGYYTVGRGTQLVTDNWYSFQSGNWNDPLTWTTISNGSLREPTGGGVPQPGDNVTILSGRTVTMTDNNRDAVTLTVNGRLDIENTSDHNYFAISGNGVISIKGDGSSNDNFPTGNTTLFADSIVGGTVEILGAGLNLDNNRSFNNVEISLDNAASVATLLADYSLNGDLTVSNGILQINDNSATTSLSMTTYGTVQIDAAGELNVGTANVRHEFNFYGDFTNNGRAEFTNRSVPNYGAEATDGIIDANFLSGSSDQTINCNGVTNFYRIEIDKGLDQTYILDINATVAANFNLFGPADYGHSSVAQLTTNENNLGLLRGTVRLNTNVDVPVLNNTGNYNIPESARLWVNGGSAEKPGGTAIVPYGTVQLSAGILNAPVNSGITTRDNGNIIVEGGTMTVNQIRTSVLGVENIGGYTQSGGTVNVTGNNISTSYYVFSLTYPGNTFNMSGGTLNVSGARTGSNTGGIFIASSESNQSITGGTVVMEINRNDDFKVTSLSPFWNVIMRYTSGTGNEVDLINGSSGTGGNVTTINTPDLRVLNDLMIEDGITFDHNGFDVEIASDFIIQSTGDYVYDVAKPNTTTINGTDNSLLSFQNRTGGSGDEQVFWNLIINKPTNRTVSLASGKGSPTGSTNNLINIGGDAFKVLSGTVDNGQHSIRVFSDSLVNYDVLGVYDPANNQSNGNDDFIKLTDQPITLVTADTSRFGNVRFNNNNDIVELTSDVYIERFQYRFGRMRLGEHNLKIDALDINLRADRADWNSCGGCFSVEDMFITNGQTSDGGLSLYIPATGLDPEDGDAIFNFPFGTGTDGLDAALSGGNSKYTPAQVTISSATDDGYITIRPADNTLATTAASGGDILSYYWRVDFEGFATLPTVEYQFTYYDNDLDGSTNEASFVAGKVLEVDPFTRNFEDDGIPENEGVDDVNNILTFNGPADTGFTLEAASYTAGQSGRFVGAPTIYYSTTVNNGNDTNFGNQDRWNQSSRWSTVGHFSGTNTGTFPQAGDIAIMAFGLSNPTSTVDNVQRAHWFFVNADTEAAKLIFSETVENSNGVLVTNDESFQPQLIIQANNAHDVTFGTVEGNGSFNVQLDCSPCNINPASSTVINANINGDFGLFADETFARFDFDLYSNNNTSVFMPSSFPVVFPNVNIKGQGGNGRRLVFQDDITIKRNLTIRQGAFLRLSNTAAGDITVGGDLNMTVNDDGDEVEFPQDGPGRTLTIEGDINMDNNNDEISVLDNNSAADITISRLRVGGNINQNTGRINLYSDAGANRDQVELELFGTTNGVYTRTNNPEMSLYRLIVNKGSDKTTTFTISESFSLNGETDGANKALVLQNGSLILNDAGINIDLTTGGDDFTIPASSGLQVTQGTVNVSGNDSGIALDGCLIIDGGTVNMDDAVGNGNNYIEYSASGNAILEISSGTLNVGSQIRPITSANTGILKYRQTGGDVRIGTQAGPESTRGMLQIYNVGSEFTYTGGTLTIERHQTTPSIAALFLDPDISDVTGSNITIFNGNTPAGQTDFRINSTIALENLTINGTNSPSANLNINTLTINNQLSIAANATLNGSGLTLTVGGDFVNNGAYDAQGNETIFNTSTNQSISGSGTNTFFRFTKQGSGTLSLTNSIDVADLFTISEGVLDDNGSSINLAADAVIDGTHISVGGLGLVFAGASNQELRRSASGTGTVGVISVNNSNGVTVPDGNGYNFNINGGLRLESGVFSVGGASILFGINAGITPVNPFSVTNMIQTNSSFVDSGIGKQFAAGFSTDFTFPVGQSFYTPVSFDFGTPGNTFGSSNGTITVRPANEFHPTINDGINTLTTGDVNNVLQYYWTVMASGVTGLTADMSFGYDNSQALANQPGINFEENDYIAARILSFNNPTDEINKFDVTSVDEVNDIITFNFGMATDNGITGDYFAGLDDAIPDNVVTYTAVSGGGDVDQQVYDIPLPNGAGSPPSGAVVIVPSGNTLRLNVDNIRFYRTEIQSGGILEVDNTTNHRLGELSGTGTLRITSDGINANLPAFSGNFLSCSGGSLEYAGTGSYSVMSGITTLRSLSITGSGNRSLANNNITICEDFTLDGPTFENVNNRIIIVSNDLNVSNGTFNSNNGIIVVRNDLNVNGGVYNGNTGGITSVTNNLNLTSGNFNVGTSTINLLGNMSRTSAVFDGGSGIGRVNFLGSTSQQLTGDFTSSNSFHRLLINNPAGMAVSGGNVEVENLVFLTSGVITMGGGSYIQMGASANFSPPTGQVNSYVNGQIRKVISGSSFNFPTGSTTFWRPSSVSAVSTGGLTWEAQYFETAATTKAVVDNLTPTDVANIATLSSGEHWVISDGNVAPSGVTARVGLSWGMASDVSATSSEREELEVMVWNDGLTSWDNLGGTSFSGGHTQSAGTFSAISTVGFSEQIFTLGSGDAANPLPITLTSFTGKTVSNDNHLEWETASEINNDYFEVQRSPDGITYSTLKVIDGQGTTEQATRYKFIDINPLPGLSYYRLKQVDIDGAETVFNETRFIVKLSISSGSKKLSFSTYPNPTTEDNINIKLEADQNSSLLIQMYDLNGRVLYKNLLEPGEIDAEIKIMPNERVRKGIYILTMEQGGKKINRKLVIKE